MNKGNCAIEAKFFDNASVKFVRLLEISTVVGDWPLTSGEKKRVQLIAIEVEHQDKTEDLGFLLMTEWKQ